MHDRDGYRIEVLDSSHDRDQFQCGVKVLDEYLQRRAGQDAGRRVAVPYVLVDEASTVCGFYTLSQLAVRLVDLPQGMVERLPRYPLVPATLLGRLGVDRRLQGQGFGQLLLVDALRRSHAASQEVASFAIVTEAKDEESAGFYVAHGFCRLASRERTLFLPMATVARLFA
ncbi:MAG: GNAT family N-acetyltransferase [Thermoleophilia bacterium]|nr:GNAT family N-acetyltransferase [Thermoleophilia bacterium]